MADIVLQPVAYASICQEYFFKAQSFHRAGLVPISRPMRREARLSTNHSPLLSLTSLAILADRMAAYCYSKLSTMRF